MGTKRAFRQGIFIFGITFFFLGFLGAEPEIEVQFNPPKAIPREKACLLTIQLTWRSGEGQYRFLMPELALDNLVMEDIGESSEVFQKEGETWKKKTFRFILKGIQPGMGRIHPFRVSYLDPSTEASGHFDVPAKEVRILSSPLKGYRGMALALGLVGVSGILGGLVFFRRTIKKREVQRPSPPTLEDRYGARLSGIHEACEAGKLFRAYLNEKYSIPAECITTRELIEKMESRISRDELRVLKRIFGQLDERRYANRPPSAEEWQTLHQEIIHYVAGKKTIAV